MSFESPRIDIPYARSIVNFVGHMVEDNPAIVEIKSGFSAKSFTDILVKEGFPEVETNGLMQLESKLIAESIQRTDLISHPESRASKLLVGTFGLQIALERDTPLTDMDIRTELGLLNSIWRKLELPLQQQTEQFLLQTLTLIENNPISFSIQTNSRTLDEIKSIRLAAQTFFNKASLPTIT